MPFDSWMPRLLTIAAAWMFSLSTSYADTPLFEEVHTIAAPDQVVPIEHTFPISTSGTYTVTVTDTGAGWTPPQPAKSVTLAITHGSTIVGTPLTAVGSAQFQADAAGDYTLHLMGTVDSILRSAVIGVEIKDAGGNTVSTFSDVLAPPSLPIPSNRGVLNDSFTLQAPGTFQVALTDLQFPQAIPSLQLILIAAGTGVPVAVLPDAANGNAMQATVNLQAGVQYFVFAWPPTPQVNAGLYSALVTPSGGGAPAFSRIVPVGVVAPVASASLSATNYTLHLSDLAYPTTLTQSATILAGNGVVAARLDAPGSAPFTITAAGNYSLYATATPAQPGTGGTPADSGAGSYAVDVSPSSGPPVISVAHAVSTPGGPVSAYTFDTNITTAGSYRITLGDFLFPTTLQSLGLVAVQGGSILGTPLTAAGNLDVNAGAGDMSLLVFAKPKSTVTLADEGMFGLTVVPGTTGTPILELTQNVGDLFTTRKISILTPGRYTAAVGDLGFPAKFAQLAVIVTHGTTGVANIFGATSFNFDVTEAGNYYVNFLAQPTGDDKAGTYSISIDTAPPLPTIDFSVNATTVDIGNTVTLKWSTTNATSCTASGGGWSGSRNTSGQEPSSVLNSTTTFTLACDGPGGNTTKSITVTVQAPSKSGGGGAVGLIDILALLTAVPFLLRARRKHHDNIATVTRS